MPKSWTRPLLTSLQAGEGCKALVALDLSGMSTLLCCVLNKGRALPFTARALREGRQAAGSWGNNEVLLCWCNSLSGGEEMLP